MLIQTTVLSLTASTLSLKREICSGSDNKISTLTIDEKGPLLSVPSKEGINHVYRHAVTAEPRTITIVLIRI